MADRITSGELSLGMMISKPVVTGNNERWSEQRRQVKSRWSMALAVKV
jgi:hypothetical protein